MAVSDGAWFKGCCSCRCWLLPTGCSNPDATACAAAQPSAPAAFSAAPCLAPPRIASHKLQQAGTVLPFFPGHLPVIAIQAKDESEVPLTINCWPSASGADSYVNIEYECNASFDLQDIVIAIPLPALASSPKVNQVSSAAARPIRALGRSVQC